MSLDLYHKKRDFNKTPEPKGGKVLSKSKNLFIIQKHAAHHLHYDFRLELNGVLKSWAIPKGPCLDPKVKRLAIHVEDHPVEYGYFEGIIPKEEYGGGTVMLWDQGRWRSLDGDPGKAYSKGHLRFELEAKKLKGRWDLIQFKKNDDKSWFLIKYRDDYAKSLADYNITIEEPNSVMTGQSINEIAENYDHIWRNKKSEMVINKRLIKKLLPPDLSESAFPETISPQLATLVEKPPQGDEWLHEIKFDGYRIIAFKNGKSIKLMSRNNIDWTKNFNNIVAEMKKLSIKQVIFDGEIVLLDENQLSNFQLLQNAIKSDKELPFIYYIFDLLYIDKFNTMSLPLLERKKILECLLPSANQTLRYSDHLIAHGDEIFEKSCGLGLEGIISKNVHSVYKGIRSKSWLKVKCIKRQEFIIGGYLKPQKGRERQYFRSLLLGVFNENNELIYCGNVGTGFTEASLEEIFEELQKNITNKNPFNEKPAGVKNVIWVKPKLVAEIEFTEWTNEGKLRHPSFKGLRNDKKASTVKKETAVKKIVATPPIKNKLPTKISNPDKVLYKEDNITKQDLFNYYDEISDFILPYLKNRLLTLVRCPDDYKHCFYQKHIDNFVPKGLHPFPLKSKHEKGVKQYSYLEDKEGLMSLVQMGVLEIHPWGSTIDAIEYPDVITFDLDPAPDVPWKKVVKAAFEIKKHLELYQLTCFVKTTGGKGLHVVVPIQPEYEWGEVKNFAYVFVKFLERMNPDAYVSKMTKTKRRGKIFVDYLRNQRGATAISAYSSRARIHAPVATPIHWDELTHDIKDTFFTIQTLPLRIKKLDDDPWEEFWEIKQSLRLDKL